MRARQFCGFFDFRAGCAGLAVCDILQHRPGEQVDLLLHHADGFAQALLRQRADVLPVDADAAARYVVETRNQVAQRGFARAGRPQHHAELALFNVKIDMIGRVNNGIARWVVLADIFKRDVAHAIHLLSSILHPYYTGRR